MNAGDNNNQLEQLRKMTTIVIDTGDIDEIKKHHPQDATTNPSLILAAAQKPQYKHLIDDAVSYGKKNAKSSSDVLPLVMDKLFVNFGAEILNHVPGRVSTEVDARLSYDINGSVEKAHALIKLYQDAGIPKERVLIKLASTWEGAQAARQLENEGIHCNLTLMFCLAQAIACADAKATLISPFVGRILDWYKKNEKPEGYPANDDPGVKSVTEIYYYFKKFGYQTQVMGASFRNSGEITELAGCDFLTIAPTLLNELSAAQGTLERKLDPSKAAQMSIERLDIDEKAFRWHLNESPMATDKLAEGIRRFAEDAVKLQNYIINAYSL